MTDNEIIKALECCGRKHNEKNDTYCKECQFKSYLPCVAFLCDRTIDLINRQKAEIERLREIANPKCQKCVSRTIECAKSEAIKEFAERLKSKRQWDTEFENMFVFDTDIDNILKEMMEVNENDRA